MAKTYYELLDVPPTASADEIKRAFRREIAKYHPDKVQHLGEEFQEIAATKAAELTRAYKALTDPASRADYDADSDSADGAPAPRPPSPPTQTTAKPSSSHAPPATEPAGSSSVFSHDRAGADNLVQRATAMRFRNALAAEFGQWGELSIAGFDITCIPKPAFWSLKLPPRVLARFVALVDGPAVVDTYAMAKGIPKDSQRDFCLIFLMGPAIAPPGELAAAISEQRRKPTPQCGKMIVVPVNTRSWSAHIPTDAPPIVKALLARLKAK